MEVTDHEMVFVEEWERCAVEIFFVRQDWNEGLHSLSCQTPCLTLQGLQSRSQQRDLTRGHFAKKVLDSGSLMSTSFSFSCPSASFSSLGSPRQFLLQLRRGWPKHLEDFSPSDFSPHQCSRQRCSCRRFRPLAGSTFVYFEEMGSE